MGVGKHWKMQKKLNNKGMSLVEVIIAMVILSLVVVPTMRLFSSSAGYNAKSRKYQRAVSVAESVMESFKAYNLEDLCKQFKHNTAISTYHLVNGSSISLGVVANSGPLDANDKLVKSATDFEFQIYGAEEEGQKFDVIVTVEREQTKNVLDLDVLNPYTDAIISLGEAETILHPTDASLTFTSPAAAISYLAEESLAGLGNPANMAPGSTKSLQDVTIKKLNRNIDVATDRSSGSDVVTVKVSYDYSFSYKYSYKKTDGNTATVSSSSDVTGTMKCRLDDSAADPTIWEVYKNAATTSSSTVSTKNLQRIYLYYFPLYKQGAGVDPSGDSSDNITITDGGLPLKVYVAKEKSNMFDDATLQTYEPGYDVKLTVGSSSALTHNLKTSLVSPSTIPKPPTILPSSVASSAKVFANNESYIKYAQSSAIDGKGVLYKVDIEVYNAGESTSGSPVATFSGTMND